MPHNFLRSQTPPGDVLAGFNPNQRPTHLHLPWHYKHRPRLVDYHGLRGAHCEECGIWNPFIVDIDNGLGYCTNCGRDLLPAIERDIMPDGRGYFLTDTCWTWLERHGESTSRDRTDRGG